MEDILIHHTLKIIMQMQENDSSWMLTSTTSGHAFHLIKETLFT